MSGDPASNNDDELLSQIDELKARMDRLMRGGSSTSNSALLTDSARPKTAEPGQDESKEASAPPARGRVADLIEIEDSEVVEVHPGPKEVVSFPAGPSRVVAEQQQRAEDASASVPVAPEQEPPLQPRASTVGGSLISINGSHPEPRPQAASFDELGNAVQQELEKDASVPPIGTKKGPDLASRFGKADDQGVIEAPVMPDPEEEIVVAGVEDEDEWVDEVDAYEDEPPAEAKHSAPPGRRPVKTVAAVWVFTAIASGAIATLHYTGVF